VIYQIYPRSFRDSNGDGIGDLPGIIEKLDYIKALGVDGIWISPFFASPMKDFGYDVADCRAIDPMFGTMEDFDRLLAEAPERDLKIIIDQVYSHTSDQHPWFIESRASRDGPRADWCVWADARPDGMPPNNWLAIFGGPAWTWEPRRRQYYLHNFLVEQPDLNFHEPAVQDAVLETARFWLDRGVDGFRLDVANFFMHDPALRDNPPFAHPNPVKPYWLQRQIYNRSRPENLAFVARFRALLDEYPGAMAVAEIASHDPVRTMVAYTDGPERYHTAYSFVFLRQSQGAAHIRGSVEDLLDASPDAWPSWAFSNHDVERVVTRWSAGTGDRAAFAKMLIALLTSLRGTTFLYQGEELGLPQAQVPFERLQDPEGRTFWPAHKGRDGGRTPMVWEGNKPHGGFSSAEPWLPVDSSHLGFAVDHQVADPESVLAFTRRYLAWRRQQPALIRGDIRFLDVPEPMVAFERRSAGQGFLCAFNLGDSPVAARVGGAGAATLTNGLGLDGVLLGDIAHLPGHGALFAELG